jgi:2-polyprenyl-3-methyl-5-hydroxy-6-metoxy-1,4-benzoquinol methylase
MFRLFQNAPQRVSREALLGDMFCSLDGPLPISVTPRGEKARQAVRAKIHSGEYNLEQSSCLCGVNADELIATVDRYRIPHSTVMCSHCGLVRTSPRLSETAYADFYRHYYRAIYERVGHDPNLYFREQQCRGEQRCSFILRRTALRSGSRSVLEIGCGAGWNLVPFAQLGWRAVGWDFDREYLSKGLDWGLNMREGSLSDAVKEGEHYDLIILSHVVEHLLDPIKDLQQVRSLLRPSGVLFVEVPSLFEVTGRLLRYFQNAHTFSFVPETLAAVMRGSGFSEVGMSDVIQSVWRAGPGGAYGGRAGPKLAMRTRNFLWRREFDSQFYERYRAVKARVGAFRLEWHR